MYTQAKSQHSSLHRWIWVYLIKSGFDLVFNSPAQLHSSSEVKPLCDLRTIAYFSGYSLMLSRLPISDKYYDVPSLVFFSKPVLIEVITSWPLQKGNIPLQKEMLSF